MRKNIVLLVLEHLGDGSYLSEIVATEDHGRRHDPGVVRVIEYTLKDTTSKTSTGWSPLSAIPVRRPRPSFAALYHQRWEIENTLDEIKTHQGGHRLVLRSRDPDGVEQEVYGFLLVHHALRGVMHHTAHQAGLDPDRISFTRVIKRKMSNWKLKHPHHRNPPRPPDPVPTLVPPLSSAPGLAVPSVCSRPLTTPATDQ
ncbi:transposase [Streptomyces sp. NPDC001678]|uniref:transposase n=1 Tax=Streptomyces sp. NPDC001678 TaxID=3364599 RepID=UPI0036D06DB8